MKDLTAEQLAVVLGVKARTVWRWLKQGCPSKENPRRFDEEEVRAWCAARGLPVSPAPSAPVAAEPSAPPSTGTSRATLATAELASKLTRARKNELELQAERGLKDLGLEAQIRASRTLDDLVAIGREALALVSSGRLSPTRGRTIQGLLGETRQAMTKQREVEGDGEPERLILMTEEGGQLVRAFEGIVSDARRAEVLALVAAAAQKDQEENPNVDLAAYVEPEPGPEVPPADELEDEP
jgi:hypothetical protein